VSRIGRKPIGSFLKFVQVFEKHIVGRGEEGNRMIMGARVIAWQWLSLLPPARPISPSFVIGIARWRRRDLSAQSGIWKTKSTRGYVTRGYSVFDLFRGPVLFFGGVL
jgi:hypothetical protein